jgi:hypothetical protein
MQRGLAAVISAFLGLSLLGVTAAAGPRERQVRVRRGGSATLRIVWASIRGGGSEPSFSLTAFEPILTGETFELIGEYGNLGRLTVIKVTPDATDCPNAIIYTAQAHLSVPVDPSQLGQVFAIQSPYRLEQARLMRPDIRDPRFDLRLPEHFSADLIIDVDGNGSPDIVRASGSCASDYNGYCFETFERSPTGAWRSTARTAMPNCN